MDSIAHSLSIVTGNSVTGIMAETVLIRVCAQYTLTGCGSRVARSPLSTSTTSLPAWLPLCKSTVHWFVGCLLGHQSIRNNPVPPSLSLTALALRSGRGYFEDPG